MTSAPNEARFWGLPLAGAAIVAGWRLDGTPIAKDYVQAREKKKGNGKEIKTQAKKKKKGKKKK